MTKSLVVECDSIAGMFLLVTEIAANIVASDLLLVNSVSTTCIREVRAVRWDGKILFAAALRAIPEKGGALPNKRACG